MFDRYHVQAQENKPAGYARVVFGKIRPDDLVWCVTQKYYMRADDPSWLFPPVDLEFVCYVIRRVDRIATIKRKMPEHKPSDTLFPML